MHERKLIDDKKYAVMENRVAIDPYSGKKPPELCPVCNAKRERFEVFIG